MQFRPGLALRGLLIAVVVCSGCHRPEPVTAPRLSIWDNAELLTEAHRRRLQGLEPLLASSGTHLAVLTVNTIPGREPGRFADRAFESFPSYSAVVKPAVKPDKATRRQNARVAEAWQPTGILIVVSLEPRLVQVRRGENLVESLTYGEIRDILEIEAYPRILEKSMRGALLRTAESAVRHVDGSAQANLRPGWIQRFRNSAAAEFESLVYPRLDIYYHVALDPVLNLLAVLLRLLGFYTWVAGAWVVALYLLCRKDILGKALVWLNIRIVLLARPLLRRFVTDPKAAKQVVLSAADIGMVEAGIIRWGIGLPIITTLSLISQQFWENVLTIRMHLYPWVAGMVEARDLSRLSGGFLFWDDFHAPVGVPIALAIAVLYAAQSLMRNAVLMWVSSMDEEEVAERNIAITAWGGAKLWSKSAESGAINPFASIGLAIAMPAVISSMPVLSMLYYVLIGFENANSAWRDLRFLLRHRRKG